MDIKKPKSAANFNSRSSYPGYISECENLKVIYLQGNQLSVVENLNFASNLTHLYLQRNKLYKIQGLEALFSLQKLYLGHNYIAVVEGLDRLKCLRELHIEHQQLPPGEEVTFDPRSIAAIGQSLRVLNLEGNGLTSLEDLVGLEVIEVLNVASNKLSEITKLQAFLSTVPSLKELDILSNPVTNHYKNRDKIIASISSLRVYNGKPISETTSFFMKTLESRQIKRTIPESNESSYNLKATFSELGHNLPEALAKDVRRSIMQNETIARKVFEDGANDPEPTPDQLVPRNASSYHFPAFKSSTCLHFEGRTIPKQFHRLVKQDPLTGRRHRSTKNVFSGVPAEIRKFDTSQIVSQHATCTMFGGSLAKDILDRGDMVWNNDEEVPGKKTQALQNSMKD